MNRRDLLRLLFVVLLLVPSGLLVNSYLASASDGLSEIQEQAERPYEEREPIVEPRPGITVVTTQGPLHRKERSGIVAYAPDGRLLYYNNTYGTYFDVDPSPAGERTVTYVAAAESEFLDEVKYNAIERVNLTTGEVERLYGRVSTGGRWHDVDRIDESRFVVADISRDSVFVVNTTTGIVEWQWEAQSYRPITRSEYSDDWTHVNDVEVLDDGRIMVSLRNFDEVVFLDPETGVIEDWTLGSTGDHETLYHQHNPDYLPAEQGGPAVLVADSENNRVVEYERHNGTWNRTWEWTDPSFQWPRDADRLPNGHTLVTNSNGGEIVEVDRDGEIVWRADIYLPYEAERLGTGDESAGGPTASRAGIPSSTAASPAETGTRSLSARLWSLVQLLVPSIVMNGVLFVLPSWMGRADLLPLLMLAGVASAWAVTEYRLSPYRVELHRPVRIRTDDGESDGGGGDGNREAADGSDADGEGARRP